MCKEIEVDWFKKIDWSKSITWQNWGVQNYGNLEHQQNPEICPYCLHKEPKLYFYDYLVGHTKRSDYGDSAGYLIMECPKCFEHFYRHIFIDQIYRLTDEITSRTDFLKVPGVYEDFLEMLKRQIQEEKNAN